MNHDHHKVIVTENTKRKLADIHRAFVIELKRRADVPVRTGWLEFCGWCFVIGIALSISSVVHWFLNY